MTQPYIKQQYLGKGPDPVEAAGSGTVSKEGMLDKIWGKGMMPYSTIDTLVSPDMLSPEIEEHLPTYNPMSLDEATGYFRGCYIAKMAEYSGKTSISDLANKVLDYDRSELSRLVSSYGLKDYLDGLKEELPDKPRYERDIASTIFDPIVRRVFREAISEGYFGLKDATDRFKDIYVNNVAEDMGIRYASDVLDVSEKTIRNRIESYRLDQRNKLSFPDDCKPRDLEGITEQETSTQKNAITESELWQQRQQQQQQRQQQQQTQTPQKD